MSPSKRLRAAASRLDPRDLDTVASIAEALLADSAIVVISNGPQVAVLDGQGVPELATGFLEDLEAALPHGSPWPFAGRRQGLNS